MCVLQQTFIARCVPMLDDVKSKKCSKEDFGSLPGPGMSSNDKFLASPLVIVIENEK